MGSIGIWQVLLVLLIVLIIFGAGKLPKVMGDFGKGLKNFKTGIREEDDAEADAADGAAAQRRLEAEDEEPVTARAAASRQDEAAKT